MHGTLALSDGGIGMSLVTCDDVGAALAAAATGRPLTYEPRGEAAYRRRVAADGAPGWLVEAYASMFTSVREGRFAAVSADVEVLTGRPRRLVRGVHDGGPVSAGPRSLSLVTCAQVSPLVALERR
jgi:hypothetical protein